MFQIPIPLYRALLPPGPPCCLPCCLRAHHLAPC